MWTKQGLLELIEAKLKGYRLIPVSNREPYIDRSAGDRIECERPASGLTLALDPIMRACGGTWIAHGTGDADREVVNSEGCVRVPADDRSMPMPTISSRKPS